MILFWSTRGRFDPNERMREELEKKSWRMMEETREFQRMVSMKPDVEEKDKTWCKCKFIPSLGHAEFYIFS